MNVNESNYQRFLVELFSEGIELKTFQLSYSENFGNLVHSKQSSGSKRSVETNAKGDESKKIQPQFSGKLSNLKTRYYCSFFEQVKYTFIRQF